MRSLLCTVTFLFVCAPCSSSLLADDNGLVAWWRLDENSAEIALDSASQARDVIKGNFRYIQGTSGTGLKFDGSTTRIIRKAAYAPRLSQAFTVEAWIAPQTYPWNWCGIVNLNWPAYRSDLCGVSGRSRRCATVRVS